MPLIATFAPFAPLRGVTHGTPRAATSPRHRRTRTTAPTSIVILGGSSGVGLTAANYLKSQRTTVTSFSRRTGHDLTDPTVSTGLLQLAEKGLAIAVGAGRRASSRDDELSLYRAITDSIASAASPPSLVVAVARPLVLSAVREMMAALTSPWVLLRPGALVDIDPRVSSVSLSPDRLMVTEDQRCNGLVSRRGVGIVVGDLLMGKIPLDSVDRKVLSVYDLNRMITLPKNVTTIADDAWGSPMP